MSIKEKIKKFLLKIGAGARILEVEGMHMGCPLCKGKGKVRNIDE